MKVVLQLSQEEQEVVVAYEGESEEPLRGIVPSRERALQKKGGIPYPL